MLGSNSAALQSVLDAMHDMVRVLDTSRIVVLTNKSYVRRFKPQFGKRCYDMFCKGKPCGKCISQLAMDTGKVQHKNCRFRGRIYAVSSSPIFDENNILTGAVEVFRDITEVYLQERALREKNKRLTREAKLAARMQRELFMMQDKQDERVQMASRYLPSSSMGGDMFGQLRQQGHRVGFYVADVSGHGIAAAMVTLLLANVMRTMHAKSAVHVLERAREAYLNMVQDDQLYIAMFAAVIDLEKEELIWANAGLNAVPLLADANGLVELYSPALPICNWQDTIIYHEHVTKLAPESRLLLYTDGLLDRKSSKLTEEELKRLMVRLQGENLLNALEKRVLPYREDDVCILLITRT